MFCSASASTPTTWESRLVNFLSTRATAIATTTTTKKAVDTMAVTVATKPWKEAKSTSNTAPRLVPSTVVLRGSVIPRCYRCNLTTEGCCINEARSAAMIQSWPCVIWQAPHCAKPKHFMYFFVVQMHRPQKSRRATQDLWIGQVQRRRCLRRW